MLVNSLMFISSLTFLLISVHKNAQHGENWPFRQASFNTPVLENFHVDTLFKTVQVTLFNEPNDLLRRSPSPSVDAAWDRLASLGPFLISSTDIIRLGKNPKISTKAPLEWGFGPDAYQAHFDGQHALKCLDAVRRYAYAEYYYPDAKEWNASSIDEAHRSHCLHILLQSLTCNYNFDLITYNWMDTQKHPFPDFGVNKKCVNHDQILDWQAENKISDEMWEDFARRGPPEGQEIVAMSPLMGEWSAGDTHKDHGH
ncbi:hypothetical protein HYFRA_00000602 [Hymenoscyphus fraxineus]|uniref:Tat pathway signal sequence n=1 Tax=Hymenoscyphus fraxineus TaxID=746836 RepID=A0A9N9L4Z1_9HELO|nr:hypothetical protein HYFRA_00000602 [Hymenoscyphus fraxineus]